MCFYCVKPKRLASWCQDDEIPVYYLCYNLTQTSPTFIFFNAVCGLVKVIGGMDFDPSNVDYCCS